MMRITGVCLRNALAASAVLCMVIATGCNAEQAKVKSEAKATVISEESKQLQNSIAAKRDSERDYGKYKKKNDASDSAAGQ